MITFKIFSLARNSRDVTIKHVHSENHSDVNRQVVAVFTWSFSVLEVGVFSNYMPLCRLYIQEYGGQFLSRCASRQCRQLPKNIHAKLLYLTSTVSQPDEAPAGYRSSTVTNIVWLNKKHWYFTDCWCYIPTWICAYLTVKSCYIKGLQILSWISIVYTFKHMLKLHVQMSTYL